MASDNQVTIVGNLTDDPELRYTPNGAAVATIRVAVNRRIPDGAGGWKDAETSFFRVNAWRTLAENAADEVGPSLRWATAKVEKQSRSSGGGDWSENVSGGATGGSEETPVEAG